MKEIIAQPNMKLTQRNRCQVLFFPYLNPTNLAPIQQYIIQSHMEAITSNDVDFYTAWPQEKQKHGR